MSPTTTYTASTPMETTPMELTQAVWPVWRRVGLFWGSTWLLGYVILQIAIWITYIK
jgi:hypothetical protein